MKNIAKILLLIAYLLLITTLFSSCTHYYYGPNSGNVPLLQAKGDGRISAAIASSDETTGFELQSSYAPVNHFGVMVNLYATGGKNITGSSNGDNINEKGGGTYAEVGGGYFTTTGVTDKWIFETYFGAGKGTITNNYRRAEKSKTGVIKFFIQPSIGFQNAKGTLQVALASRFSSVDLKVTESNMTTNNNPYDFSQVALVKNNPKHLFWEPAMIIKMGLPNAKVQLQLTPSYEFNKKDIDFQWGVFSIGIIFSFNSTLKK